MGAGSFRAAPGVLIDPLQEDFGWSKATISSAVTVNLILFGLTAPFAAALMDRFGMRVVVANALTLIATGSFLTLFMTQRWQLVVCWGVLVGLGAGSMALAFVATVTSRWFVRSRGLVTGILTAGTAAGQLVFLPVMAWLSDRFSWRAVSLTVTIAALAVVPLVLACLRNRPQDVGTTAYGANDPGAEAPPIAPAPARRRARLAARWRRWAAPPGRGRSGCWPARSRSAAPARTASSYDLAWFGAGALCAVAALMSYLITKRPAAPVLAGPVGPSPFEGAAVEALTP